MRNKIKKYTYLLPLISSLGFCSIAFGNEESIEKEKLQQEVKVLKEKAGQAGQAEAIEQRLYVGILMGGSVTSISNETLSDSTFSPALGLTAGLKLSPRFGIGFFGSRYGMTSSNTILGLPVGTNSSTTLLLGQVNFIMGGFHIGGEVGPAINSWDGNVSALHEGTSNTAFAYGPQGGIDFRIDQTITVGAEFHYLFSLAQDVSAYAQGLAVLKLWL